jgi:hypothetical protein
MPCGTWTTTGVPDAKLGEALAQVNLDAPQSVTKTQQADGSWTIVATFPPCPAGQSQTTNKTFGT